MTNKEVWETALRQSALEFGCQPEDFQKTENVMTISKTVPGARCYLPLPFDCDMVSYGSNIVAQTSEVLEGPVREYLTRFDAAFCFETPHIYVLDELLAPYGKKACFMAAYFLPDVDLIRQQPCDYELRILYPEDFRELYLPQWSNALCEKRKHLDTLGVGAYDGEKLIGLAGCSRDCDSMYQIGVDVLPEYRRKGIAAAVTSCLALEVLKLGKVPFYCAAWCNLKSVKNAIRCGFRPGWVELTARDVAFVEEMNGKK